MVPLDKGIVGHAARTGVGVNTDDAYDDSRFYNEVCTWHDGPDTKHKNHVSFVIDFLRVFEATRENEK